MHPSLPICCAPAADAAFCLLRRAPPSRVRGGRPGQVEEERRRRSEGLRRMYHRQRRSLPLPSRVPMACAAISWHGMPRCAAAAMLYHVAALRGFATPLSARCSSPCRRSLKADVPSSAVSRATPAAAAARLCGLPPRPSAPSISLLLGYLLQTRWPTVLFCYSGACLYLLFFLYLPTTTAGACLPSSTCPTCLPAQQSTILLHLLLRAFLHACHFCHFSPFHLIFIFHTSFPTFPALPHVLSPPSF